MSFPAKWLSVLQGLTVLPCGLIEVVSTRLLVLVVEQAARRKMNAAEPIVLWVIESSGGLELDHPAVVVADITPYYPSMVRILNGANTVLAVHALPLGLRTVGECVAHPEVGPWLEALLAEEIVPVLEGWVVDPAGFARTSMERFRNPFFEHALSAIALNHDV